MKFTDLNPKDIYDLFNAYVPATGSAPIKLKHCTELVHFGYAFKGEKSYNLIRVAQPVACSPLTYAIYRYHVLSRLVEFLDAHETLTIIDLISQLLTSLQEIEGGLIKRYKEMLPDDYCDGGETENMKPHNIVVSKSYAEALSVLSLIYNLTIEEDEREIRFRCGFSALFQTAITISTIDLFRDKYNRDVVDTLNLFNLKEPLNFPSGEMRFNNDTGMDVAVLPLREWLKDKSNYPEFMKVYEFVKEAM